LQVCELHFRKGEIERETSYFHETSGKFLTVPLEHPRLVAGKNYYYYFITDKLINIIEYKLKFDILLGSVPSQFPGPAYYSKPDIPVRKNPSTKRLKLKSNTVQNAIEKSMETFEVERSNTIIHNLNDVYSKLQELQLDDWTLLKKETNLYVLCIEESPAPVIKCYIKISEGLVITLNYQNQELKRSDNKTYTFPFLTNNINDLENFMSEVPTTLNTKSDINEDIADSVGQVIKLLTSMKKTIPDKEDKMWL
jgi:hypothetical protein